MKDNSQQKVFEVIFYRHDQEYRWRRSKIGEISLPVTEEGLAQAEKKVGADRPEACRVLCMDGKGKQLENALPGLFSLRELNDFAEILVRQEILQSGDRERMLMAALEAELPDDLKAAGEIAEHLERYELLPEEIPAEDAVPTSKGRIRRKDRPVGLLQKELTEIRLFSPLKAVFHPEMGWKHNRPEPFPIFDGEICRYEKQILEQIAKDPILQARRPRPCGISDRLPPGAEGCQYVSFCGSMGWKALGCAEGEKLRTTFRLRTGGDQRRVGKSGKRRLGKNFWAMPHRGGRGRALYSFWEL